MKRLRLKIYGKVQGVYFRSSAREKARELGLSGWVKNMPDGTVETAAEGEEAKLNQYLQWCKKGSSSAWVEEVREEWQEPSGEFKGFSIKY